MILGFTGSREGITNNQRDTLTGMLEVLEAVEAHHGCCIGADAEFVLIAGLDSGDRGIKIHAHPSTLRGMTDREALSLSDVVHEKKPPLDRNKDIVDACDLLVACPKEKEEQLRSGTWSTVRYARKRGKPVKIILPDGTVKDA